MSQYAIFTGCIFSATLASILWIGPYWFLLVAAFVLVGWLAISAVVAASQYERELERMRWDHPKSRGD